MARTDKVGLARQDDIDTAAAEVSYNPPVSGEEIAQDRETLDIDETTGTRAMSDIGFGGKAFTGAISGALRPVSGGLILSSFLGSPTSTQRNDDAGAAIGVYDHVFDPLAGDAEPSFLTVWTSTVVEGAPPVNDQYIGARGNSITLSCEANDYFLYEAEMLAKRRETPDPLPSMTLDTSGKWPFHRVSAEIMVPGGQYTSVPLRSFSAELNNNLADDTFVLGTTELQSIAVGNLEIEVTFTPAADIEAFYRRALMDTPENVALRLTAVGGPIGDTGINHSVVVELHRLQTTEADVPIDAGETSLREIEVTSMGSLDPATGKIMTVTLTNGETGALY